MAPLGGTRRVGGLLGVAGRLSGLLTSAASLCDTEAEASFLLLILWALRLSYSQPSSLIHCPCHAPVCTFICLLL